MTSNTQETCNFENKHIYLLGTSGGGKTYWIKRFIKNMNMNYIVYAKDFKEWKDDKPKCVTNMDFNLISKSKNLIVVLDDIEELIRSEENVINLWTAGRHEGMIGVIVGHSCKSANNKVRQNTSQVIIMSRNTAETFKDVKDTFGITDPIENFKEPYGYISYDCFNRTIKYYDKDSNDITSRFISLIAQNNKQNNNNRKKIMNTRMLELIKFKDTEVLSYPDERKVKMLLEQEFTDLGKPVNIPNHLIRAYLVMYYKYNNIPFNIKKYEHIITDYYSPWSYVRRWFIPILKLYKDPENTVIELMR